MLSLKKNDTKIYIFYKELYFRKICGTPFRLSAQIQRIQNSISSAGDINISSQINSRSVLFLIAIDY